MMKKVEKILGSPDYLRGLIFAGKYAALLQFVSGFFFCGLARFGGPLGSSECADHLVEAALSTLMITLCISFCAWIKERSKPDV